MRTYSCKTNKLRNLYTIRGGARTSPSKKGKLTISKLKSILDERSRHRCHLAATCKFGVFVDEDHSKLPTLYWLPNFHKKTYKSRFIANSSLCTTTEVLIILTSCLTTIKNHVLKYCATVFREMVKIYFVC